MRTRYLVVTVLSAIIFAAIFALRAAGSLPQGGVTPMDSAPDQAAAGVPVEGQIDEPTPTPARVEPAATQETRQADGRVLLEGHCSQCHTAEALEQIKQTREDWEKALKEMEGFGVRLDEAEKTVLLDYLVAVVRP